MIFTLSTTRLHSVFSVQVLLFLLLVYGNKSTVNILIDLVLLFMSDELMSALDQDTAAEQPLVANTEAITMPTKAERSKAADGPTHGKPNKALSRKTGTRTTTCKKKATHKRAPRRPVVCVPCKKHFTRRQKLDQHNRLTHDMEVSYSFDDCHKPFSHSSDNIGGLMKHGKCHSQCQQSPANAELSVTSEDSHVHEPTTAGTFIYIQNFFIY